MSAVSKPILANIPQTILTIINSYSYDSSEQALDYTNAIIYAIFAKIVLTSTENVPILFLDIDGVLLKTVDFFLNKKHLLENTPPIGLTQAEWYYSYGLPPSTALPTKSWTKNREE